MPVTIRRDREQEAHDPSWGYGREAVSCPWPACMSQLCAKYEQPHFIDKSWRLERNETEVGGWGRMLEAACKYCNQFLRRPQHETNTCALHENMQIKHPPIVNTCNTVAGSLVYIDCRLLRSAVNSPSTPFMKLSFMKICHLTGQPVRQVISWILVVQLHFGLQLCSMLFLHRWRVQMLVFSAR